MILRLCCIHLLIAAGVYCGDLFSSMAELENLVITETNLVKMIDGYIESEMNRLERVKRLVDNKRQANEHVPFIPYVGLDSKESIANPINAFLSIKRVVQNRNSLFGLLRENTAQDLLSFLSNEVMPREVDINGAATALLRLQDTYQLDPVQVADGIIGKYAETTPMTADDTFQVAYTAFSHADYYHALQWLLITKEKMERENGTTLAHHRSFTLSMLYDYMSYAMHDRKNPEHALWYSRALNAIDPKHPSAEFLDIYQQIFNESGSKWDGTWKNLPPVVNNRPLDGVFLEYEALCRGESRKTPRELSNLYCFRQRNTPFLKLAPMNVEIISFSPYAVLYRGILSDDETEHLKRIASPQLKRAMVVNDKRQSATEAENMEASYRVAKNMWLNDNDDSVVARISKRMSEATGLSMETAEQLQMANYGLGGHYEPHYDMAIDENKQVAELNDRKHGNRIATALFYMSEPAAGGATVFEELGLTVFPIKNDCLFWFNVHKNGRPDLRTRHAGCPVLLGQKWVANKWIHERGQEFLRPCDLSADV